MIKTVAKIDGMMCNMCESHMNDAIRKNFDVEKVTSSHSKKESVIISENPIDETKLKEVVENLGYDFLSVSAEDYEKKSPFSFFKK
jgi:copper chaperone CopZ